MKGQGCNPCTQLLLAVEIFSVSERTMFVSHCWLALCSRESCVGKMPYDCLTTDPIIMQVYNIVN